MRIFKPLLLLIIFTFGTISAIQAQTLLFKESFESGATGWTVSNTCNYNWMISSNKYTDGVKSAIYSSSYEYSGCTADLFSPLINLSNPSPSDSLIMYFDFERSYGNYSDRIELQMVDENKIPLSTPATVYRYYLGQPAPTNTGFIRYIWKVSIGELGTRTNHKYNVRIRGISGRGYDMFLDNIELFYKKTKSIAVTAPNGGEVLNAGSTYNIKWTSNGISNVNIDFSVNGGVNWNSITTNYDATSQNFNWIVPAAISKTCKVRVTDAADNRVMDESNNYFEISEGKTLTLISPNGGESITAGSTYNIKWDAQNINTINIDFSVNGGVNWTSITTNADATQKNYNWIVPNTPSLTCKIKVTDASDANRVDESNAYFSIAQTSGITDVPENNTFRLFPNPSTGLVTFEFINQNPINSTISVRDVTCRVVFEQNILSNTKSLIIDLNKENLSEGVYFVEFKNSNKTISQKLILK